MSAESYEPIFNSHNIRPQPLFEGPSAPVVGYLQGVSIAGCQTCIYHSGMKIAFDMGCCPDFAINANTVLLSHGHMDHASGVFQHASRRELADLGLCDYTAPTAEVVDFLRALRKNFIALNGDEFDNGGSTISKSVPEFKLPGIRRQARSFKTTHRVPSCGYVVSDVRKKLKPEYTELTGKQIGELVATGVQISDEKIINIVGYTGDTTIDFLPHLDSHVETMIVEMTYICDETVAAAVPRGHIHLNDVVKYASYFVDHFDNVVFTHFSARYSAGEIRDTLRAKLPPRLLEKSYMLR